MSEEQYRMERSRQSVYSDLRVNVFLLLHASKGRREGSW